ncbi:sugar isomerase domain-containing protein [Salibacterium salarium]|uniref:UPF0309 protein D7Z54_01460 n=1 Tax=Salibacterium salarium TaxID=284579 RepID=A0A3R9WWU3_9BACI|nr:SIS domain-containing protein [Salibacterium salarium]RSL35262.1 sugar isomerase domain-containing protein [Salibacterium salarium]
MAFHYIEQIQELLHSLKTNQQIAIEKAVSKVSESIINDGIIHVFGAGHSHILSEEVFFRAGGLAPINPLFEESLMLHNGALQASINERKERYIEEFLESVSFRKQDVLIVISTSGRNPVPIDVAEYGKKMGLYVIGITSMEYSKSQPSRHENGWRLYDCVDLVLDNLSKEGDALLTHPSITESYGASSTVIGTVILQTLFAGVIEHLIDKNSTPPIFLSGNMDGADAHNKKLMKKYEDRIPLLRL